MANIYFVEDNNSPGGKNLRVETALPLIFVKAINQFIVRRENLIDFELRESTTKGSSWSSWQDLNFFLPSQNRLTTYFDLRIKASTIQQPLPTDDNISSWFLGGYQLEIKKKDFPSFFTSFLQDGVNILSTQIFHRAFNALEYLCTPSAILPTQVLNFEEGSEDDFISYWFSICHFLAIFAETAKTLVFKQWPTFYEKYLRQFSIIVREDSSNLSEILLKGIRYIFEMRGTPQAFEVTEDSSGELFNFFNLTKEKNGDYFRKDELLAPFETGWCIGRSSPLQRGTSHLLNFNLFKFEESNVENANFDSNTRVLTSSAVNGGLGIQNVKNVISINDCRPYESVFQIQGVGNLSYGIHFYDKTQYIATKYFLNSSVNFPEFVTVRGITVNDNYTELSSNSKLNIRFGTNLVVPERYWGIVPFVRVDSGMKIKVDGIVSPANTSLSLGSQLGLRLFFIIFTEKDNTSGTLNDLLPYDVFALKQVKNRE